MGQGYLGKEAQEGIPCPEKSKAPEGGAYPGQVAERRCVCGQSRESEQQEMKAEK